MVATSKLLPWYLAGLEHELAGRGEEGGRGLEAHPSARDVCQRK